VHGLRKLAREAGAVTVPDQFVPVAVTPTVRRSDEDERTIEVELRRGSLTVKLSWPISASMNLSTWMRELLR
jgi:transposase